MNTFAGMPIVQDPKCATTVPIFPDKPNTKRRRRRTLGKFGRLTRTEYRVYRIGGILVVHPVAYARLKMASTSSANMLKY